MEWQGIRVKIAILAFIVVLGLLFGGQVVYQKYGYHQPLRQALEQQEYVKSYEIDEKSPVVRITVTFTRTDNLMESYQRLDQAVWVANSGRPYELVVADERNATLNGAYYDSQFAVYQAIIQGSFPEMARVVQDNAREAGAEAKIFVDNRNVYIQMETVDHYLNVVVPRSTGDNNAGPVTGGGLYA
ncbi:MAG: hypothetical protein U1D96_05570 [Eubacteriales bacterium]|jgi:hypothetical protein|nr:hypothetical protein [Bacillota bacterium]MBV1726736.1 hypothetical protein [Desulforudis sp.]MDP3051766.1 hypothetical protein [Eubacteriales bacterium]MDQ7790069.1 hypothetical protein [Clostridia bacterium]MBV1735644.1 hypothetical protein [Desulforudis sp.]